MEILTKRKFDIDQYHLMSEAGIINPDERVELIDGDIVQMSPTGDKHLAVVSRINALLTAQLLGKYIVHVQSPVKLSRYSEPEPDLMVVPHRDDYYASTGIHPSDVLLLIEVSDTTLRKDTEIKLPLYAQAGIPEVWIVDLNQEHVTQYTDLESGKYQQKRIIKREDQFSPSQLKLTIKGTDLLG